MNRLHVDLGRGLTLKNPIIAASGCFGFGEEYAPLIDLNLLGGISSKGTTLRPRPGNPPPRIAETAAGMLNAIGLENPGIDRVLAEKIPFMRRFDTAVILNISGFSVAEYAQMAHQINEVAEVQAIELNISCPNTEAGGKMIGTDPAMTRQVVAAVRRETDKHLMLKLTPNVTDITEFARIAQDSGADSLSVINTLVGMAIDVRTRRPRLSNITGGLSGPAIKPVALAMVWKVAKVVTIPVIGIGGIASLDDVLEFMIAGASAVQVGTMIFADPQTLPCLVADLENYCQQYDLPSISEIVGTVIDGQH